MNKTNSEDNEAVTELHNLAAKCRQLTASQSTLTQYDMLAGSQFANFLKDRLEGTYWEHSVFRLWNSGVIRTDYVEAKADIQYENIDAISSQGEEYYIDNRPVPVRRKGWGGALSVETGDFRARLRQSCRANARRLLKILRLGKFLRPNVVPNPSFSSAGIAAYFHPFKILPVYTALKLTSAQNSPLQYLLYDQGLITVAKYRRSALNRTTRKQTFTAALEFANCLSEICIALEPIGYRSIFRTIRWRHPDSEDTVLERIEERMKAIGPKLEQIGLKKIEELRRYLVQEAEIVEGNKRLHMIVRLTNATERGRLKGDLGLSTIFLTMAEVMRRVAEEHFAVQLPEEDELGFGQWYPDARKLLYGTDRILDADRMALVTFMEQVGLNHGTKIRCYVEGVTEAGALRYVFDGFSSIVVIDLGGLVVQKRGKGVAFRDSLRTDIREQVFSFVFIDGDRSDYLSAVRKAADDGDIVGAFFVSNPDFEIQNFSTDELLYVACSVGEVQLSKNELASVCKELANCKSGSEFFKRLKGADSRFFGISKGAAWGEGLMKFALEGDREREITSAANFVLSGLRVSYALHKRTRRTDVKSGRPVKINDSKDSDTREES